VDWVRVQLGPTVKLMRRNRLIYAACIAGVVALGLFSRSSAGEILPDFVEPYAGDTLWALMVFLGLAFIFRGAPTWKLAAAALAFSYAIELSQFIQTPRLNDIRHTKLGGLVLGFGFKWTDLVCYTVGVAMGAAGEWLAARGRADS